MNTTADYYEIDRLSFSALKEFAKSPAHYLAYKNQKFDSEALRFGRFFHSYILEPQTLQGKYFSIDETQRPNTSMTMAAKVNKEWKADIIAENKNKTLVKAEDAENCERMAAELNAAGWPEFLKGNTEVEKEIFYEFCGVEMKSKLDFINHDLGVIVDLKTTTDLHDLRKVNQSVANFKYYQQAAIYGAALTQTTGKKYKYYLAFCDKKNPGARIMEITPEYLELGLLEVAELVEEFSKVDFTKVEDLGFKDQNIKIGMPHYMAENLENLNNKED